MFFLRMMVLIIKLGRNSFLQKGNKFYISYKWCEQKKPSNYNLKKKFKNKILILFVVRLVEYKRCETFIDSDSKFK